jgi:hypothetical protein
MSEKGIISAIDDLLRPLNFTRKKTVWNRRSEYVVEVIDLQVSKAGGAVTVNAGVLDIDVHKILWGNEPSAFVEEPACTVRARAGDLIGDKDLWWQLDADQTIDEVFKAITEHALPFVKRMRSRQHMVQWLTNTRGVKKYPLPTINLAILQHILGNLSEGCALLAEVRTKAVGAWCLRATEVTERLGCKESSGFRF